MFRSCVPVCEAHVRPCFHFPFFLHLPPLFLPPLPRFPLWVFSSSLPPFSPFPPWWAPVYHKTLSSVHFVYKSANLSRASTHQSCLLSSPVTVSFLRAMRVQQLGRKKNLGHGLDWVWVFPATRRYESGASSQGFFSPPGSAQALYSALAYDLCVPSHWSSFKAQHNAHPAEHGAHSFPPPLCNKPDLGSPQETLFFSAIMSLGVKMPSTRVALSPALCSNLASMPL